MACSSGVLKAKYPGQFVGLIDSLKPVEVKLSKRNTDLIYSQVQQTTETKNKQNKETKKELAKNSNSYVYEKIL
jgi:hypothetical protein